MLNILKQMGIDMGLELPYGRFFKPNDKFLEKMSELKAATIEMGCGVGYTLKCMKDFGDKYGFPHLSNSRGFDLNARTDYDDYNVVIGTDALTCPYYHKNFNVLVCRADHSGWVGELLDDFLDGRKECKRFICTIKPENLLVDFTPDQISKSSEIIRNVGEDGEDMYIWEIS